LALWSFKAGSREHRPFSAETALRLARHFQNVGRSVDEQANIDGDRDIVSHPVNATAGPNYFDDIVTWRTQLGLMGELNNASCYMPWR
jgi:hypothetical protein